LVMDKTNAPSGKDYGPNGLEAQRLNGLQ
jgi:hypothetical protein